MAIKTQTIQIFKELRFNLKIKKKMKNYLDKKASLNSIDKDKKIV